MNINLNKIMKFNNKINASKTYSIFLFTLAIILLSSVFMIEYFFNLVPCKLCYLPENSLFYNNMF